MKTRLPGGYVYFGLGLALVTALTFIELPCPISGGTGILTGAEGLKVTEVELQLIDHKLLNLECGWDFERYIYAVEITLVNEAATPAYGAVVVRFHDPEGAIGVREVEEEGLTWLEGEFAGPTIAGIPIFVEVPAETTRTIEKNLTFDGITLLELFGYYPLHNVTVDVAESIVCPYDGGTGKVPLYQWLWLKAGP